MFMLYGTHVERWCQRGTETANNEEQAEATHCPPSTDAIGNSAPDQGAKGGTHQQGGGQQARGQIVIRRQVQIGTHEMEGIADYAGAVAEEETPKGTGPTAQLQEQGKLLERRE
jgi:hypothetical protein